MDEDVVASKKGGGVAKRARKDYEIETGKKAVSGENFLQSPKSGKKLIDK